MSVPARFRAFRIHGDDGQGGYRSGIEAISLDDLNSGEVVIKTAYSSVNYKDALAGTGEQGGRDEGSDGVAERHGGDSSGWAERQGKLRVRRAGGHASR